MDDDGAVSGEKVDDVLQSILVDNDTADRASINGDGTYRVGLIRGHAVSVEQVRFIGRNARKRYRQEQIENQAAEIETLEAEKRTAEQNIEALRSDILKAKDAITDFPADDDLSERFSQIKEKRFDISQYEKKLRDMDEQMNTLNQSYREIKSQLDAETRELDLEFSYEAYQEAKRIMRQYEKDLHSLINRHTTYRHTAQQLDQIKNRLEELTVEVDDLQGELNVLIDRQTRKEQNIAEIEKQLETAGVDDIRRQIREVQETISATNLELDQIKTDLPKKEANRDVLDDEIRTASTKLEFWTNMITAWKESFCEEVNLGFVEIPDREMETENIAAAIAKQYKDFLKEKDPSTIESQLTSVYFEQQSNLMEYRMTDTERPASESDWMHGGWRDEQRIQINNWKQKADRRLIQLDFQGKRVSPYYIKEKIESDRMQQQSMLDDQDRQLY